MRDGFLLFSFAGRVLTYVLDILFSLVSANETDTLLPESLLLLNSL